MLVLFPLAATFYTSDKHDRMFFWHWHTCPPAPSDIISVIPGQSRQWHRLSPDATKSDKSNPIWWKEGVWWWKKVHLWLDFFGVLDVVVYEKSQPLNDKRTQK